MVAGGRREPDGGRFAIKVVELGHDCQGQFWRGLEVAEGGEVNVDGEIGGRGGSVMGVERGKWGGGRERGRKDKTVRTGRDDEDLLVFFKCWRVRDRGGPGRADRGTGEGGSRRRQQG
jgi:hypothetical protein